MHLCQDTDSVILTSEYLGLVSELFTSSKNFTLDTLVDCGTIIKYSLFAMPRNYSLREQRKLRETGKMISEKNEDFFNRFPAENRYKLLLRQSVLLRN